MTKYRLREIQLFLRSWAGVRDEFGYLISGPEWDTDDIVAAMNDLLEAYKEILP